MAINKAMRAALKAITAWEADVKKSYKAERQAELLLARLRGRPADYQMWNQKIMCGDHNVPVRMFRPASAGPFPVLLFFHGGGWVTGGIENYTGVCADLAKATGHTVASVDYHLAPEYRFPAAPEDCYAVAREFFMGISFQAGEYYLDRRQRRGQSGRGGFLDGERQGGIYSPAADSVIPRHL